MERKDVALSSITYNFVKDPSILFPYALMIPHTHDLAFLFMIIVLLTISFYVYVIHILVAKL